jgi:hypothetical protein
MAFAGCDFSQENGGSNVKKQIELLVVTNQGCGERALSPAWYGSRRQRRPSTPSFEKYHHVFNEF